MTETDSEGEPDDAIMDLLVKRVSEGLSAPEQRVFDALDDPATSEQLRNLERAVAAVSLAAATQPLPPAVRARLEMRANAFLAAAPGNRAVNATGTAPPAPRRAAPTGTLGWFAAAACLVLALLGWFRAPPSSQAPVAMVPAPPAAVPQVRAATPAEERAALLAKADVLKITLAATKDPAAAGVTGDVVWDARTQKGFLHFVGLTPNDPQQHEYQIWIFDGVRDKRYPVDGGVFDVPADAADVVIPIRAALLVHQPAAFAVTLEKPGGVVVSSRDHVVVLGTAG